jgi:hypothetical protein
MLHHVSDVGKQVRRVAKALHRAVKIAEGLQGCVVEPRGSLHQHGLCKPFCVCRRVCDDAKCT